MNWKRILGYGMVVAALGFVIQAMPRMDSKAMGPKAAYADNYQLAVSSWTVQTVQVSTFVWTQMDNPALVGRKNLTIYNVDTSSAIYCRQDTGVTVLNVRNDSAQPINSFAISPAGQTSPNPPSWVTLSLSNFSSNNGAYPVSTSMPVYCISARLPSGVITTTATVVQSF